MKAIECKELVKNLKKEILLDKINIQIEEGSICALVGKEKAEKTTLMNCLCTKTLPTEGEVFLLEESAYENKEVLREICFVRGDMDVFYTRNIKKILKYARSFYKKRWNKEWMNKLLEQFEIDIYASYEKLSDEKRAIVGAIIGLCCNCRIVMLDEVFSAFTERTKQSFFECLLEKQKDNPRTYVISVDSPWDIAEEFTDILILDKGKSVYQKNVEVNRKTLIEKWEA